MANDSYNWWFCELLASKSGVNFHALCVEGSGMVIGLILTKIDRLRFDYDFGSLEYLTLMTNSCY